MRIAFFVSQFPALSETFIVNQVIELKRSGHQVHIYAQARSGEEQVQPGVLDFGLLNDTVFLDSLPRRRVFKMLRLLGQLLRLRTRKELKLVISFLNNAAREKLSVYSSVFYLGRPDYEVVHAHFGVNGNYVASLKRMGLFAGSRFVTTFHGYDLEAEKAGYEKLFRVGDVFTTNSDYSVQKLLKLGCPTEKLVKLPVGLDVNYFKREGVAHRETAPFTILFVGRLVPFKGPDRVVRICDRLRQKGLLFQAILVGEGEMKEALNGLIREHALEKDVKLLGPKTQEEVRELMAEADVFLLPGRTVDGRAENQGLVIQEAQAMGLPVIVSDAGGMKEGMIEGSTGFVVPENDVVAFVNKLEFLAGEPMVRKQMGEEGRRFVAGTYDARLLNRELLKLYLN